MTQDNFSALRNYSHIYVEEAASDYPDTKSVIERFSKAKIIPIKNYKEILNRSKQNWLIQKKSQKIILAKRQDEFLYKGTDIAPNFSHKHFYYNALTLNCLYNCHYCYLQGMYPSAHTVLFVNNDDYLAATAQKLKELGSMYLCISYDTDLLAFESILPQSKRWIDFASKHPNLIIEIRTKSINIKSLLDITPVDNVKLAWTLSPNDCISQHEESTPNLEQRLAAMKKLTEKGWKVRVCIDPILPISDWKKHYSNLVEEIFSQLKPNMISDFTIGTFRMPDRFFKETKKIRKNSTIFHDTFEKKHGVVMHQEKTACELKSHLHTQITNHYPKESIFVM